METIKIWGEHIPYNSPKEKFQDHVPQMDRDELWQKMREWFERGDDPNRDPVIRRQVVMQDEIGRWGAKWTFEDEPYLIPFVAEESRDAVVIIPGGAYVMKSMEHEGTEVAQLLNAEGVSCFVLWYRTWPYRFPAACLDAQRAVRYLKAHAAEYGFSPERVSLMGFSAGGNAAAGSWHLLKQVEHPLWSEDYLPDDIDAMDPRPHSLALIYAALEVSRDPQCLHMLAGKERFEDPAEEKEWIQKLDLRQYICKNDPPHFLCYGTEDTVVLPQGTRDFAQQLKSLDIPVETTAIEGADHGFGSCVNPHRKGEFAAAGWQKNYAAWLKKL